MCKPFLKLNQQIKPYTNIKQQKHKHQAYIFEVKPFSNALIVDLNKRDIKQGHADTEVQTVRSLLEGQLERFPQESEAIRCFRKEELTTKCPPKAEQKY